jgi:hypothetical protein
VSETPTTVEKRIKLPKWQADWLERLARAHGLSEEEVVRRALGLLAMATEILGTQPDRSAKQGSPDSGSDTADASDDIIPYTPAELAMFEKMLAEGLISEIRPRRRSYPDFEPIVVKGKPLSEIIIEERR